MTQLPQPARPGAGNGWVEIPHADLDQWNRVLLGTQASLFQFPYWNEPLRALRFRPRYFVYSADGRPRAFVCVLQLGIPGVRAGLIQRGPVLLGDGPLPADALPAFARWARRAGYVFLRCSHERDELLAAWAALPSTERTDPFPFYREPPEELLVPQHEQEDEVLRSFQPVARRNLRHAGEVGYRIESSDDPDFLRSLWPLFEELSDRKNFRYRPLESFLALLEAARPHQGARVFAAYLDSRAVQAILVVRDATTARYVIGALDVAAIGERESPSVLLHWHAMRYFTRYAVKFYDLGTRSGPVYRFKQKFRPIERRLASPVTVVTNPILFRAWCAVGLGTATKMWPKLKRMLYR